MDWKDALAKMAADNGLDIDASDPALDAQSISSESSSLSSSNSPSPSVSLSSSSLSSLDFADRQRGRLHVVKERKGRGGKVATIIEGFTCDDDTLQQIAALLKKRLGTGGSARGGEILIQGDMVEKVKQALISLRLKC